MNLKSLMSTKTNILGKSVPIFLAVTILSATVGTAALLTYFGRIEATFNVEQSILVDNQDIGTGSLEITDTIEEAAPGGEEFCFKHWLENQASVSATVGLDSNEYEGITTTYYIMPEQITLILEDKSGFGSGGSWTINEDNGVQATLTFGATNPSFDYDLTATGLEADTEYAIIYYADKPERFDNWGGDNPGKLIDTFTTDTNGDASKSNSVDIGMNLPQEPDANINQYNYCLSKENGGTGDMYDHCHGAKIWIVPAEDYEEPALTAWNPEDYLFETDMVTYFDCDIDVLTSNYPIDEYGAGVTSILLESGQVMPFFTCYDFDIAIMPGTYQVTTDIVPSTE